MYKKFKADKKRKYYILQVYWCGIQSFSCWSVH